MRLIPVCSGKGGTGKSCVCVYTAAAMAGMRKKTLIIDTGPPPGSLDIIAGAHNKVVFNLWDVLYGVCEAQRAIVPCPVSENLFLLAAGVAPQNARQSMGLMDLIRSLKSDYDYIFVDSLDMVPVELKAANTILMVATPDTLSVRAASQRSRELYDAGANNIRLVINNVPARVLPMQRFKDFDDIIDQVGAQLIAVVPQSQRLHHSANNGLALTDDSLTLQVFHSLAERLRGKHEPLLIR